MKKLLAVFFGFVVGLSALLISFLPVKKFTKTQAEASYSVEQKFYDNSTQELISKNPQSLMGASADKTPFDTETKQRMEGISITPNADDYGQVKSFSMNLANGVGYTPTVDDNILVWIYLIDAITFKLEISLNNNSSSALVWIFDSQEVYEMGSGWKLVALKLSDFQEQIDLGLNSYSLITFKYFSEMSDLTGGESSQSYNVKTNERFSIYHVFTSKNANLIKNSGILLSLSKSFYEFSDDFITGKDVFVGDKIQIDAPSKIFKYFYIGKNDITNYLDSGKYFWHLSIKDPNAVTTTIDFGETINFYQTGFYYLKLQLFERKTLEDESVFYSGLNIYCDELYLGHFKMGSSYKIVDNEKLLVSLTLSDALTDIGELSVTLSNNNAEIETYYEENGVLYVCLAGKADGNVKLEISADAKSKYSSNTQTFSSVASISVEYTEDSVDVFNVILWITFGTFCLVIIIYLSISVVKARKNDVK